MVRIHHENGRFINRIYGTEAHKARGSGRSKWGRTEGVKELVEQIFQAK